MIFAKSIAKQVDSLKIKEVKKVKNSNYVIYCFGEYEYESKLSNYKHTQFYTHWNKDNQIYKNSIKLNLDEFFNEKFRLDKLKDFFFQSLGYFNLIDDFSCDSYFSNCYSKNKKVTKLDIELLKYHYSYGICKGTSLKTFEDQHKRAQEAMKRPHSKMSFYHTE